jgi:hypothetical protein
LCYSGKKKRHALKHQFAVTPDGETIHVDRAAPGPKHDKKLTERQSRRQLGAQPVLYAVLEVLQVRTIINHYCQTGGNSTTGLWRCSILGIG